jgi:hypothetical protein
VHDQLGDRTTRSGLGLRIAVACQPQELLLAIEIKGELEHCSTALVRTVEAVEISPIVRRPVEVAFPVLDQTRKGEAPSVQLKLCSTVSLPVLLILNTIPGPTPP